MATLATEFSQEEILEGRFTEGALDALSHLGSYVDSHIDKFAHSKHHPEIFGAVNMLTGLKEFIKVMKEIYEHPDQEQQILENALKRHAGTSRSQDPECNPECNRCENRIAPAT